MAEFVCNYDISLCDGLSQTACQTECVTSQPKPNFCGFCEDENNCKNVSLFSNKTSCEVSKIKFENYKLMFIVQ